MPIEVIIRILATLEGRTLSAIPAARDENDDKTSVVLGATSPPPWLIQRITANSHCSETTVRRRLAAVARERRFAYTPLREKRSPAHQSVARQQH